MSGKTFRKLPEELQSIILDAGAKAGAFGREIESREDGEKLTEMLDADQITVTEFEGREKLLDLVVPVQDEFAAELGASELLESIRSM